MGWGSKVGASTMFSIDRFNLQFLYTLFFPTIEFGADPKDYGATDLTTNDLVQIAGFSMKADVEVGLTLDMIYRFDHKVMRSGQFYDRDYRGWDGLEASIGIDYTFAGGDVYFLAEYMFYGPGALDFGESLDALYKVDGWEKLPIAKRGINERKSIGNFLRHNYLFAMVSGRVNDYLSVAGSTMINLEDGSWILTPFIEVEPFQAFTIRVELASYYDLYMFSGGKLAAGEFGPSNIGTSNTLNVVATLKF